jgi:hypothetical protein
MNPFELQEYLDTLVLEKIYLSTMIWGPARDRQVEHRRPDRRSGGMGFIDVRLSQLAPTDLRGLPVPDNGISRAGIRRSSCPSPPGHSFPR